mgnify:CR=1 FL=1
MQMVESETRVPYMTASEPAQYAVFGQPVAHSLSPRIHNAFARQLGIALEYRPIETSAEGFAAALKKFADLGGAGANVTLPLKQVAAKACASLSDRARRADSVNTLSRSGDGWHGDSTDGVGLIRDITSRHRLFVRGRRTLLLGAGGAARAVAFALLDAGVPDGFERKWRPALGFGPERHLGYAVQWFAFALVAIVMFVALNLKRAGPEEDALES